MSDAGFEDIDVMSYMYNATTAMLTATSSARTEAAAVLLNRKVERSSRYCHRPSEGSGHHNGNIRVRTQLET